jgi:hypothetical protein
MGLFPIVKCAAVVSTALHPSLSLFLMVFIVGLTKYYQVPQVEQASGQLLLLQSTCTAFASAVRLCWVGFAGVLGVCGQPVIPSHQPVMLHGSGCLMLWLSPHHVCAKVLCMFVCSTQHCWQEFAKVVRMFVCSIPASSAAA